MASVLTVSLQFCSPHPGTRREGKVGAVFVCHVHSVHHPQPLHTSPSPLADLSFVYLRLRFPCMLHVTRNTNLHESTVVVLLIQRIIRMCICDWRRRWTTIVWSEGQWRRFLEVEKQKHLEVKVGDGDTWDLHVILSIYSATMLGLLVFVCGFFLRSLTFCTGLEQRQARVEVFFWCTVEWSIDRQWRVMFFGHVILPNES